MITKKTQAAMEFLMTYGWSILVVLAAIGALAYFGVLSPEQKLPEKCTLPAGIACLGFSYNNNNIELFISNSMGYTMTNISITVENCPNSSLGPNVLKNGDNTIYKIPCDLSSETKINRKIHLNYTNKESGLQHTKKGNLIMKVITSS